MSARFIFKDPRFAAVKVTSRPIRSSTHLVGILEVAGQTKFDAPSKHAHALPAVRLSTDSPVGFYRDARFTHRRDCDGRTTQAAEHPLADRRGYRPGAGVLRHGRGPDAQRSTAWRPRACATPGLHHGAGLLRQPLGIDDRHVPNHDRRAQPSLAPRRRLPALPPGVEVDQPTGCTKAGYFTANMRHFPAESASPARARPTGTSRSTAAVRLATDWRRTLRRISPSTRRVNFQETHRPFRAPKQADPAKVVIPPYYPDHPVTRDDWAEYLDAVQRARPQDRPGARATRGDGLADDTIVMFFGRPRPVPRARQAVLLRGGAAHPADHPLAEELPAARRLLSRARWTTG